MSSDASEEGANVSKSMVVECKQLIMELCEEKYPRCVSSKEISDRVRLLWPDHRRWEENEKHGETKFIHDINNAREELKEKELICSPESKMYRLVKKKHLTTGMNYQKVWGNFISNFYRGAHKQERCEARNVRDGFFHLKMVDQAPAVFNKERTPRPKRITEEQVKKFVRNINLCGGMMEKPFGNEAELSAIVHCSDFFEFDSNRHVIRVNYPPQFEFYNSLEISDKAGIDSILETLQCKSGERTIKNLIREAKQRSKSSKKIRKSRSREFDLVDPKWVEGKENLTHCEVTGIPFADNFESGPFARSLDCRDPSLDYTIGNVDVVVSIYNLAKNKWSPEVVRQFCIDWYEHMNNR